MLNFLYVIAKSAVIAYIAFALMGSNSNFLGNKNKQFDHFVDLLGVVVYFIILCIALLWFGGRL